MHIHLDDQYHQGRSWVHQLDPRVKVALTFGFVLTVSLIPVGKFVLYALLASLVLLIARVAGLELAFILKRSMVALPFALAAITLPFTLPGQPLLSFPWFGGLSISLEGTLRFLSILVKSWISVQMAIILVTVTTFPMILWGLRELRIPQPLLAIIGFMYRYLFVLADETLRLMRARTARSALLPGRRNGGTLFWRGQVAGRMAGSLMLRSFERSERIYQAMLARGYRGQFQTLEHSHLQQQDLLVLIGGIGLLLAILVAAYR
jgi:cobalt/nickel transport system permease protein